MPVNDAITDSVTQVNTKVVGEVPAMAMGNSLMTHSHSLANAALNATNHTQQAHMTLSTATVQGINQIMSVGSSITGRSATEILTKG